MPWSNFLQKEEDEGFREQAMRCVRLFSLAIALQGVIVPGLWAEDLRDVKGPVAFPPNFWLFVLPLALVAGLLSYLLVRFLIRRIRQRRSQPPRRKSAHEIAYERLQALKEQDLPSKGLIKEYFFQLSNIIRHYIEGRFGLKAPEMTTPEFLWSLKTTTELDPEHKGTLDEFLNFCDAVKFAKYGPTADEIEQGYSLVRKFVDETRPAELSEEGKA